MKKYFSCRYRIACLLILFCCPAWAQVNKDAGLLLERKVGDTVPDYALVNLINYPTPTEKLSAFKGKLVILDFWSSYCASCIEAFSKMEGLQKEFGNRIQIILVNAVEDEQKVRAVFAQRKRLQNLDITLPAVCLDSNIKKIFPYSGLPAEVWIDAAGAVKSITNGYSVKSDNITAMLEKKEIHMEQKLDRDKIFSAKYYKPFFIKGNGGDIEPEDVLMQSVLTRHVTALMPCATITANPIRGYVCCAANVCIRDLYRMAYSQKLTPKGLFGRQVSEEIPISEIVLEMPDTNKYVDILKGEYNRDNVYVYHLSSPPTSVEGLRRRMRHDLEGYFGLEARWEWRKKTCYVFSGTGAGPLTYKNGDTTNLITIDRININNVSIEVLIQKLIANVYYFNRHPIINETGLTASLGAINVEVNVLDPVALDKALRPYGLRFKTATRWVKVLVLRTPRPANAQLLKL